MLRPPAWQTAQLALKILAPLDESAAKAGRPKAKVNKAMAIHKTDRSLFN
jgi:hypothetical protein